MRRIFMFLFQRDRQDEDLINNINRYDNDRKEKENSLEGFRKNKSVL
jgi:hypothetical protein